MQVAAGEARKAMASATSCGWPMRPMGRLGAEASQHGPAVALDHALHDVGLDHTRCDRVGSDAPFTVLERDDTGQLRDRALRRGVGRPDLEGTTDEIEATERSIISRSFPVMRLGHARRGSGGGRRVRWVLGRLGRIARRARTAAPAPARSRATTHAQPGDCDRDPCVRGEGCARDRRSVDHGAQTGQSQLRPMRRGTPQASRARARAGTVCGCAELRAGRLARPRAGRSCPAGRAASAAG